MDQYEYLSMTLAERDMYEAQQSAITRANESLLETMFGRVNQSWTWEEIAEATRKRRRSYAIHSIKTQPFFMPDVELTGAALAASRERRERG